MHAPNSLVKGSALQDLAGLAAVIRLQVSSTPLLVVFDNVWDGGIFRRGLLDIMPDLHIGGHTACLKFQDILIYLLP